ncbi:MAG: RICIN domain-containing protein [Bacillota bacterium]|nr:RICIN domain-containing protein [Bacillota bacterium]
MKKQATKILIGALFMSLVLTVANFDFSWANTEGSASQSTNSVVENVEKEIEFLYIESSELESPGTQNIAVAWDKDMSNITKFVLVYSDGERAFELAENNRTEKSVLFTKKFTSAETGTYKINGIKYYLNNSDKEQYFEFKDIKIRADFSVVNEQNDSLTTATENNVITTSIEASSISENVEDLLSTANVDNTNNGTENKVVVIDPGHGGAYSGACRNGLVEKHLTLKIAKYLREELQEYEGVEVYMTRETDTSVGRNDDYELTDRVLYAASKNADLLVSVHINAGGGKGAEVWTPNDSTYREELYHIGQAVSSNIQRELVALGLYDRGVKTKDCTDNGRYPDGSLQDYYGIIRESREQGFTGIIVEHAFIDNTSDAEFLKSETNLKKLGIADATGIANYYNLKKEPTVDVADGTYTINSLTEDFRLEVASSSFENSKTISITNKSVDVVSSQRFEIISTNKDEHKILLEHSGKALDVRAASIDVDSIVQQYEWNGTDAQKWFFVDTGEGNDSFYIKSKLGTYLAVDQEGNAIKTSDKGNAHKWTIEKSESRPVADGIYGVANKTNSSMMLDISGASMNDCGNAQMYSMNSTLAQKFDVKYVGKGYYRITAMHSNKVLDVASASAKKGANLWQYTQNGTDAQLWKFIDAGDGYYYLKSKLGTVIAPVSNNIKNSTNVAMTSLTGSNLQKWMLEDLSRPISDGTYLILSGKDSLRAMTNKNSNVQINIYENLDGQKYSVDYLSNGYYRITNKSSKKVLEVAGSSKTIMTNLKEGEWENRDSQLWQVLDIGNGKYFLKSKLGTFIDVSSGSMAENNNIWMYSYNGTAAQIWKFDAKRISQPIQPIEDGTYVFKSALKSDKVMDVSGGSIADTANIQLYSSNDTSAQRFIVTYIGDGYYNIVNEKSRKSIDVANGSNKAGANLWQYTCNGTDAQKWKFIDAGNGYYYIKSPKGTVIDVKSAMTWNGTNIWMYTLNGTNAQKWKLKKCEQTSIMGTSNVTSDELAAYYNSKNKKYPYSDNVDAPNIKAFAQIYIEECNAEGIRADIAFCQAMKETGWLQFKGDVNASQYNFAGLGATGNGNPGNSFKDIRIGVRAHVQHLKAYACEDPLANECVDPRFKYVDRGVAPYVEWLGQKENPSGKGWATDKGYGVAILEMVKEIK